MLKGEKLKYKWIITSEMTTHLMQNEEEGFLQPFLEKLLHLNQVSLSFQKEELWMEVGNQEWFQEAYLHPQAMDHIQANLCT